MSGTIRESPADFRNGDLISRLLAATPPYQTNSTFVPPGLYFSEMLKRFVQAKSCPPSALNKRGRKRSWKDATPAAGTKAELHHHQQQQQQQQHYPSTEPKQKKTPAQDFVSIPPPLTAQTEPPPFPLWYPPFYPPAYPPVYFKAPETEPLNLQIRSDPLKQDRHYSAFRVPEPSSCKVAAAADDKKTADNRRGTSYLMGNLTKIYRHVAPEEERIIDVEGDGPETVGAGGTEETDEKKDCKDLTALIGLELVVDYVKHGNNKDGRNEQNVKCCQNS